MKNFTRPLFLSSTLSAILAPGVIFAQTNYKFLETGIFGTGDSIDLAQAGQFELFITSAYTIFLTICIVIAVIMIVIHGLEYMLSDVPMVKVKAKGRLGSALTGLTIALTAWLFLYTLNPRLVDINLELGQILINNSVSSVGTTPTTPGGGGPVPPIGNICADQTRNSGAYIIANEGWRNEPYNDHLGRLTIGIGHLCKPGECTRSLSDEEVKNLFSQDYAIHQQQARESAQRHGVNFDSLSPNRQTVLVDMAFNMGAQQGGGLDDFNATWQAIKNQNWDTAANQILSSTYASQVPGRARMNAEIMRTDSTDNINRQISANPRASSFCS